MRTLALALAITALSATASAQEVPAKKPAGATPAAVQAAPTASAATAAPAAAAAPAATAAVPKEPQHEVPAAEALPVPHDEIEEGHSYATAAIATGAVIGVLVANAATGGMMTPVVTAGAMEGGAVMGTGYLAMASEAVVTAIGAVGGGYLGNWFYLNQ